MRVAVVSGSFRPGFSYQENLWSELLARRGEAVHVFAPALGASRPRTRAVAGSAPYALTAVPARGLAARQVFHTTQLAPEVRAFGPDLILWFGPPQRFGVDVARDPALAAVPLVAFMGQNRQMHAFDWRGPAVPAADRLKALAYRAVRASAVALAGRRAARVVCNTPETAGIVTALVPSAERAALRAKLCPTPLGFDPAVFAFEPALRAARRRADGVAPGRIVAVVSSRFAPEKEPALALVFDALHRAMGRAPRLDAVWVGFDDGPVSRRFARAIARSPHRARFARQPFLTRRALGALFCAADLAVFARPSISAQEALGCGLFAVLADGGSMDWLLDDPADGRFFAAGSAAALAEALVDATAALAAEPPEARAARAARARRLGYDRIIDRVLDGVTG